MLMGIAVCFGYWYFTQPETSTIKTVIPEEAEKLVNLEADRINKSIDTKGFEHSVMDEVTNIVSSVTQLDDSSRRKLDSVMSLLRIERKQLKEYKQYTVTWRDSVLKAVRTDTGFKYVDKWASIEFVSPKDSQGTGHFNFNYNAELNHADYWKRTRIMGKKKHYIDFWVSDNRATVNGVKRVKFEVKEPLFKVDFNASTFYTDRLNIGLDGGVNIGRTRIGGGYFYDMVDERWRPLVSIKFKLIDF
ncbi:hypothetical protein DI53_1639 [Sphingobacterium deserti]|uniref:Uncharacterized protein n=2 Tax=Sphingobacterium deserti TaxID=1229276 RepID=A0A0B8T9B7_9SPHI|nr:hypothetical protein DI53_1639 [Sphingobacterium deserti]